MDSSPAPENETPNQRQARLRRERRQAKIAAGGDRLKKIIGVDKREVPDDEDASPRKSTQALNIMTLTDPRSSHEIPVQSLAIDAVGTPSTIL
jgi:hypothetical protein